MSTLKNANQTIDNLESIENKKQNLALKAKIKISKSAKSTKGTKSTKNDLQALNASIIAEKVNDRLIYQFQKEIKLSAIEQKKKRSALRRKLISFCGLINLYAKRKESEKLNTVIKDFKIFFESQYINKKLELKNVFTNQNNETLNSELNQMISNIKKSDLKAEFNY